MRIAEAYGPSKFGLSFELFPPKSPAGDEELDRHLAELMRFEPAYVTCTYGAAGSTRDKTLEVVSRVRARFGTTVAAHLTCVGSSRDELRSYLREAHQRGVENIVALRGDPPQGEKVFRPAADGLRYANELVALVRAEFPQFGIAVAGYPETHQEAPSSAVDLDNLARKVAAGADIVITQLFYGNADFFRFRDNCAALKIRVPIVPGVLPITNLTQIRRITNLCGAKLPARLVADLEACGESTEAQFEVGVDFATRQVQELIDSGVPGVHFYVLNRSAATMRVLGNVRHSARTAC
jgi:methylenetetrahydrofolate reductase (NADPH)